MIVFLDFKVVDGAWDGLGCFNDWLLNAGFGILDDNVLGFSFTSGDEVSFLAI